MTCPPCTHDCNEGRNCPLIAINAQVVGYVAPQRTWVGLTDEEVRDLWSWSATSEAEKTANTQQHAFAQAIEAKLKEKNT